MHERPSIAILGSSLYLQEIVRYLSPFYAIAQFEAQDKIPLGLYLNPPDLILVDDNIEKIGGINLTRAMKNLRAFIGIPFFVVFNIDYTTVSQAEESRLLERVKNVGASNILLAPFNDRVLNQITSFFTLDTDYKNGALPQNMSLKKSVDTFQNVFSAFTKSTLFHYDDIQSACIPIVAVISDNHYDKILEVLRDFDGTTFAHSIKVAAILSLFGSVMGLTSRSEQLALCAGGILHDIGKINIPLELLNKKGPLTPKEFNIIKKHVNFGIEILQKSDVPPSVVILTAQHHEKMDGSGYPKRLSGKDFHSLGRMVAIVDCFIALTEVRSYHLPVSKKEALKIMKTNPGHYDLKLLQEFESIVLSL